MLKTIFRFLILTVLTSWLAAIPWSAAAADEKADPPAAAQPGRSTRGIPFRGKISKVDKTAKTITVGTTEKARTFQITSETRLMKAGKPAILDDAVEGEEIGGTYRKTEDGKLQALSVRLGAKPEQAPPARRRKKEAAE
jgi:hypothetical protein